MFVELLAQRLRGSAFCETVSFPLGAAALTAGAAVGLAASAGLLDGAEVGATGAAGAAVGLAGAAVGAGAGACCPHAASKAAPDPSATIRRNCRRLLTTSLISVPPSLSVPAIRL